MDLILRNARLTSRPGQTLFDIGIAGGRVAAIEPTLQAEGQEIDVQGRLASAGFVETHIHLDKSCLLDRCRAEKGDLDEANESPRSKLQGIKPPLAYSCGPPVWRGGGWCLLGMCCLRTLEQPQLDVLAMQLRIAFVTALLPHICAHDGCIPMTAYGTDAIPFGPQLASPQTLFDGGDTAENETLCLLCR